MRTEIGLDKHVDQVQDMTHIVQGQVVVQLRRIEAERCHRALGEILYG